MSVLTPTTYVRGLRPKKTCAEITQAANSAKEAGINGVPTFIVDGRYAVSGAQAPETLAQVIRKAAAEA